MRWDEAASGREQIGARCRERDIIAPSEGHLTKRQILEELKRDELIAAVDRFDLPVADRRVRDLLIEVLASSRKAGITEILGDLKRDRLKELCRAFGLDDSGREKAAIIERLTGTPVSTGPPEAPAAAPKSRGRPPCLPSDPTGSDPPSAARREPSAAARTASAPVRSAPAKDEPNNQMESRLWSAADELRANSKLKSSEYSVPVLGLIFLRYADHKFTAAEAELAGQSTGRRQIGAANYQARGGPRPGPRTRSRRYLPARFQRLRSHLHPQMADLDTCARGIYP